MHHHFVPRTLEEIQKKKWDDVKRITTKSATNVRKDMKRTEGGETSHDPLNNSNRRICHFFDWRGKGVWYYRWN